jgi:glycosyltransferase involved in cell wall biosynthesis
MKTVSIIVPVYNLEKYIAKCLESLVNQTLRDIQIIVVNDGSTDNSEIIINRYIPRYPDKITYIRKGNGGLSSARNAGLDKAEGEYIGCVDGDDHADITMFEKLYQKAKKMNADYVECDYYHEYPDRLKAKIGKRYSLDKMLAKGRCGAWNKIIKKEIIIKSAIKYPEGLWYEDLEYFCKIIPHINTIGFVKEPLYYYVQRQDSICHTYNEKMKDIFKILDNVLEYYQKLELFEKYKVQLEYIYTVTLLGGSFFNMVKIPDKKIRGQLLSENWLRLENRFPHWRKNAILQKSGTLRDLFVKTQNKYTYKVYAKILGFFR